MKNIDVIIETPKGSHFKYKYDAASQKFSVHKALPEGLVFPYDFGFIPQSKGEDGDPLDVMVLSEFSFLQNSILKCKILGSLKAKQTEKQKTIRNDRIFVTPEIISFIPSYKTFEDIPAEKLKEIENFFIYYNAMEGKNFEPAGILNEDETLKIIKQQLL